MCQTSHYKQSRRRGIVITIDFCLSASELTVMERAVISPSCTVAGAGATKGITINRRGASVALAMAMPVAVMVLLYDIFIVVIA